MKSEHTWNVHEKPDGEYVYTCKLCGAVTNNAFLATLYNCPANKETPVDKDPNLIVEIPIGIDATLKERGARYGKFVDHARCAQRLKEVVSDELGAKKLDDDMQEAIDMVMHKIARIITGDPHYADSWHDIAGYAKLVDDRLNGKVQ